MQKRTVFQFTVQISKISVKNTFTTERKTFRLYGGKMQFSILLAKTGSEPHGSFTIEDVFINLHAGDTAE